MKTQNTFRIQRRYWSAPFLLGQLGLLSACAAGPGMDLGMAGAAVTTGGAGGTVVAMGGTGTAQGGTVGVGGTLGNAGAPVAGAPPVMMAGAGGMAPMAGMGGMGGTAIALAGMGGMAGMAGSSPAGAAGMLAGGGAAGASMGGEGGEGVGGGGVGGGGVGGAGSGAITFADVYPILTANCATADCHGDGADAPPFPHPLFAASDQAAAETAAIDKADEIVDRVNRAEAADGHMPEDKPSLAEEDLATIEAWVATL